MRGGGRGAASATRGPCPACCRTACARRPCRACCGARSMCACGPQHVSKARAPRSLSRPLAHDTRSCCCVSGACCAVPGPQGLALGQLVERPMSARGARCRPAVRRSAREAGARTLARALRSLAACPSTALTSPTPAAERRGARRAGAPPGCADGRPGGRGQDARRAGRAQQRVLAARGPQGAASRAPRQPARLGHERRSWTCALMRSIRHVWTSRGPCISIDLHGPCIPWSMLSGSRWALKRGRTADVYGAGVRPGQRHRARGGAAGRARVPDDL